MKILTCIIIVFSFFLVGWSFNPEPAMPPGTYMGEFLLGDKFFEFKIMDYTVALVFRGFLDSVVLLFIVSSPDNPIIPGGYAYAVKSGTWYSIEIDNQIIYLVQVKSGNKIKVWIDLK